MKSSDSCSEEFNIRRIKGGAEEETIDYAAREVPLTINLNGKELVTLLSTPRDFEDLARGFLFTSGLIKQKDEIKNIVLDKTRWQVWVETKKPMADVSFVFKRLYTSGCGKGAMFYNTADILHRRRIESGLKISAAAILALMRELQRRSALFMETGGVHSAGLSNSKAILVFREDIGRHNAVDKIIGRALEEGIDTGDKIILTSGRISSDILLKAQKCMAPILVSRSAPTDQAVKLARDINITVAGFARGNRINIYSAPERVV